MKIAISYTTFEEGMEVETFDIRVECEDSSYAITGSTTLLDQLLNTPVEFELEDEIAGDQPLPPSTPYPTAVH